MMKKERKNMGEKHENNFILPDGLKVPNINLDVNKPKISPIASKCIEQMNAQFKKDAEERGRKIDEFLQRDKERTEGIKKISELIAMLAKSTASNDKLSKRMFWLTVATAILTIVQIVIAIIQLASR
jgi:hypothetical protein